MAMPLVWLSLSIPPLLPARWPCGTFAQMALWVAWRAGNNDAARCTRHTMTPVTLRQLP